MTSRDPRAVLRDAGLRPKKHFGQNFLVAPPIARAIAGACVHDDEIGRARVVEIGAGTGVLTRLLVERARSVVAIERDRDLVPLLTTATADLGARLRVVEGDAQAVDIGELLGEADPDSPRVLCGNLPYSISGALLRTAVGVADRVDRVVFMLQDEVVSRLAARPGTKEWGALSVFVTAAFDVRRVQRVPPGAFHPPPEVTSAVVEFVPLRPPRAYETERFRELVRAAFGARRKTLRNAWTSIARGDGALEAAAAASGIALEARGETLSVEAFARMATALDARAAAPEGSGSPAQ